MDPWELAHDSAGKAGVELRPVTTLEDADRVVEVMVATWGRHQLLPRELIRALQAGGNVPYAAFEGDRMVGFVLGFLGPAEELHVHSHMLAVLPDRRHGGVGYALKLAQRAQALDAGVLAARWTFDPLVARNAHFNLVKLGAVADRFRRHFYGEMTDVLNAGERTDRLEARWDLEREPGPRPLPAIMEEALGAEGPDDLPRPTEVIKPTGDATSVRIPRDHPALRERDRALADAWREASADAIEACLAAGLVGTGFLFEGAYVFTRP